MVESYYGILNLNQDSNDRQRIRLSGRDRRADVGVGGLVVNQVQLCVVAEYQGIYYLRYVTYVIYFVIETSST